MLIFSIKDFLARKTPGMPTTSYPKAFGNIATNQIFDYLSNDDMISQ